MIRKFSCTVENPIREEWAHNRAKHDFILANSFIWDEWQRFCPKPILEMTLEEYAEAEKEFYKRIKVVECKPTVGVIDGYYKITSVLVSMEYRPT